MLTFAGYSGARYQDPGAMVGHAARRAGKPVTFIPADMNHEIAREKAKNKGRAAPTDFREAAHGTLAKGD